MKKIKFLAVAAMLAISTGAFAQSNSAYFQWSPSEVTYHHSKFNFTGLSLGYNRTIGITESVPLSVEVGGALQYSFGKEDGVKMNMFSIKVPVNLTYDWDVTDKITIAPFAGFMARFNIWGEWKYGGESTNMFSDDGGCKRFQLGWQAGANFKLNKKYYVGCSYGTDLTNFIDIEHHSAKIHALNVTAGMYF